ncbi:DUF1801 domain-containing protein [Pedobacter aquatilis]|uniref:DUF1801 domain-containing protein n=1 Tax=Pedobacter aquatilis TaxID=351343 RepID=UPI00292F2646|nr:DUF1801 domain-containing protein [Pedobacter aquatilis]
MKTSIKTSPSEQVSAHIVALEPALSKIADSIRKIILSVDEEIAEHIKWNSPGFYYTGMMKDFDAKEYKRDIAVLNLHRNRIMLVLPTGVRVTEGLEILEGDYKDGRRIINFKDLDDVLAKAEKLKLVIRNWLDTVEK